MRRLRSDGRSELYLGVRECDGREVILKCFTTAREAERELLVLHKLEGPGVVWGLDVDVGSDPPALVLEKLEGESLADLVANGPLDPDAFLIVARQLADTLFRIHGLGVIHCDLKPHNVIMDPGSLETWIIDFDAARELGAGVRAEWIREDGLATPHYMSPEQTRRLGRPIDFRSDLYGLGATLYHLLTGRTPFQESEHVSLMHAHIAVEPTPPHVLRPGTCVAYSRIVSKLLEKEPDDRYQSAYALAIDLRECQRQLQDHGTIDPDLVLGTADMASRPLRFRRLYGRDKECAAIEAAFERTRMGKRELWFVRGAPGVGKSALVEAVRAQALAHAGCLAQGKFDLYERDRPYHGWIGALGSLLEQLLARGGSKSDAWEERLRETLGGTGGALLEIAPDLGFLLDDIEPVPPLGPAETLVRLGATLARLMEAIATPEHPVVLVLDDMQWADESSRALLLELLRSDRESALLLLCTYRDNEEEARSSYARILGELDGLDIPVHSRDIAPLGSEAIEQMLSEVFERAVPDVRGLADCTTRKTGNNPLLVQQFLEHLRGLGLIRYVVGKGWTWSDVEVAAADIPDGAVGLMLEKIARLAPHVRDVLVLASFVGDEFDADLLRGLTHRGLRTLEGPLLELSEIGMIAPCRAGFRFVHDRIREAAQSLLSVEERASLHYDSANLLFGRCSLDERRVRASALADQFNRALDRVQPEQRIPVVQLNLWAAERALAEGATATASRYAEAAHQLLHADDARRLMDPAEAEATAELRFELEYLRARIRTLSGRHAEAEAMLEHLAERARSSAEIARAVSLRIETLANIARERGLEGPCAERGIEIGVRALRTLGAPYPEDPGTLRAVVQLLWAYASVRGLTAERLMQEAVPPDERQAAILKIESALGDLASTRLARSVYVVSYLIRHLREGWGGDNLPYALALLAVGLVQLFDRNAAAERLCALALELIEQGYPASQPFRTTLTAYLGTYVWTRPRSQCARELERMLQPAVEEGGSPYSAAMAAAALCRIQLDMGAPLRELHESCLRAAKLAQRAKDFGLLTTCSYGAQCVERLTGATADALEVDEPPQTHAGVSWAEVFRGHFWFLLGEFERSVEAYRNTPDDRFPSRDTFQRALANAICAGRSQGEQRRAYGRAFRRYRRTLRRWARRAPHHFQHQLPLVEAERAFQAGRPERALELGRACEQAALEGRHTLDAAIARERCVHYLVCLHRDTEAARLLRKVMAFWDEWGATAKLARLRHQHEGLLRLVRDEPLES